MTNTSEIAQTDRLLIRKVTFDDAPFLLELMNQPAYHKNIGDRGVRTVDDAKKYVSEKFEKSYTSFGFGLYLVELKSSKERLGICGLVKRPEQTFIDIGFAYLSRFWGKGYAAESAQAIKEHARRQGLKQLAGICLPDNEPSIRVLEKIGMRLDRMIRLCEDGSENRLYVIDL